MNEHRDHDKEAKMASLIFASLLIKLLHGESRES